MAVKLLQCLIKASDPLWVNKLYSDEVLMFKLFHCIVFIHYQTNIEHTKITKQIQSVAILTFYAAKNRFINNANYMARLLV